jgi:hypothetical protein
MMTDQEKEKVREIRDALIESSLTIDDEEATEEIQAEFVGTNMATIDGLFAIREGESWRGLIDPKEIAREVLRQAKIGE